MAEFELNAAAIASLVVLIVALVVALALVVYLARYWRQERATASVEEPQPPRELAPGESATLEELLEGGRDPDPFLMRFVKDAATGEDAGESIAVHERRLVVKGEEGFVAVPLGNVVAKDDELVITEGVNWEDAKRHAEAWQNASESPVQYDSEGNPVR